MLSGYRFQAGGACGTSAEDQLECTGVKDLVLCQSEVYRNGRD
jgi:hypothetical protein